MSSAQTASGWEMELAANAGSLAAELTRLFEAVLQMDANAETHIKNFKQTLYDDKRMIIAALQFAAANLPAKAPSIPICTVTGAVPGDGGACGDCDPCIMGEASVPEAVKRLIAEKNSLIHRNGELEDAQAWQPEESAPKDGSTVIVCTDTGIVGEAYFHTGPQRWYWAGNDPSDYVDGSIDLVTLWQALPQPPAILVN